MQLRMEVHECRVIIYPIEKSGLYNTAQNTWHLFPVIIEHTFLSLSIAELYTYPFRYYHLCNQTVKLVTLPNQLQVSWKARWENKRKPKNPRFTPRPGKSKKVLAERPKALLSRENEQKASSYRFAKSSFYSSPDTSILMAKSLVWFWVMNHWTSSWLQTMMSLDLHLDKTLSLCLPSKWEVSRTSRGTSNPWMKESLKNSKVCYCTNLK